MTLGEIMDLPSGTQICVHGGLADPQNKTIDDVPAEVLGTALFSYLDTATGESRSFLGIQVTMFGGGLMNWLSAALQGVSPEPDGVTWVDSHFVTLGDC